MPGNGPALLRITGFEWPELLNVNCQATNNWCKRRQVREIQSKISPNQTVVLQIINTKQQK